MTAIANVTPIHPRFATERVAPAGIAGVQAPVRLNSSSTPTSGRLRITRRGRIVLGALGAMLVAAVLAAVAMLSAPGAVASNEAGGQEFPYVLAQPGDSLWTIASELDPSADTRDVVAEIMRLNQLPSSGLQAGDAIAVPTRFAGNELTFPASELGN